ncbi:hypothetical protein [Robertmurraya massiliosenegalensis]|uniref:hypothetical protein n=1 Tax=Robertmurraya massiliosenegalensis TaxID=1287657 RepID=UPI0002E69AB8|nr:hypothetical protein [Robertmurraya massiliosenegalensis]
MCKKWISIMFILMILVGCTRSGLSGNKPPMAKVVINEVEYETVLGTYCWSGGWNSGICVDTAGPAELLKEKEPISVKGGEMVTIKIDFEPRPTKIHVEQFINETGTEVPLEDLQISSPKEPGIYFYSIGAWWLDEDDENVSLGDAFYAFALEVSN